MYLSDPCSSAKSKRFVLISQICEQARFEEIYPCFGEVLFSATPCSLQGFTSSQVSIARLSYLC